MADYKTGVASAEQKEWVRLLQQGMEANAARRAAGMPELKPAGRATSPWAHSNPRWNPNALR